MEGTVQASRLGLCQHLAASCVHIYNTVKYDAGNCNLGRSVAKS